MADAASAGLTDYINAFGQAITWVIVIVGWFIVNNQQDERECRKETRVKIDSLCEKLNKIEAQSIKFHTSPTQDNDLALEIRLTLRSLYNQVKLTGLVKSERNQLVRNLRQAITLHNFDTTNFVQQENHSQILSEISSATDALEKALENSFYSEYY